MVKKASISECVRERVRIGLRKMLKENLCSLGPTPFIPFLSLAHTLRSRDRCAIDLFADSECRKLVARMNGVRWKYWDWCLGVRCGHG